MLQPASPNLLPVLERARMKAARIAIIDPRALPIFARLDREVEILTATLKSKSEGDVLQRARALLDLSLTVHDYALA